MKLTAKQHENIARGMQNVKRQAYAAKLWLRVFTLTGSWYSRLVIFLCLSIAMPSCSDKLCPAYDGYKPYKKQQAKKIRKGRQ